MKRKGSTDQEAQSFAGSVPARSVLTPHDVQAKEFRVSRMGGYRMRDVDEFLDQITDSLSALIAENARLRETDAPVGVTTVGGSDVGEAQREAERILSDARQKASLIEAEAGGATPAASTAEEAAAVQAFLRKERDFLRSLGSLVQGHAEEMKGMAKGVRKPPSPPDVLPAADTSETSDMVEAPGAPSHVDPEATQAMSREELEAGDPEPIRLADPEPASTQRKEGTKPEGSLRDLFWGEEG